MYLHIMPYIDYNKLTYSSNVVFKSKKVIAILFTSFLIYVVVLIYTETGIKNDSGLVN
jgi:hypothetical protein